VSHKKNITWICYGISFAIYIAILLWGMLGNHHGSYFGWGIASFYLVLPTLSFTMALIINMENAHLKWIYPLVFSAFGLVILQLISM
jgi:hypothetical protein